MENFRESLSDVYEGCRLTSGTANCPSRLPKGHESYPWDDGAYRKGKHASFQCLNCEYWFMEAGDRNMNGGIYTICRDCFERGGRVATPSTGC